MKIMRMQRIKENLILFIITALLFINAIPSFAAGNLNYFYDAGNRLIYIEDQTSGYRIEYTYDESGNRIQSMIKNQKGIITVNPDPDSLNAPWIMTGPNAFSMSFNGDAVVGYLTPGDYTVTWGDVAGWDKPYPVTASLAAGDSILISGLYHLTPVVPIPPTVGIEGSILTINGSNFGATQGNGYVDFNGVHGSIISWSDNQIIVRVPVCGVTSGCLRIVTDYGTSACMDFVVKAGNVKRDFNADGIADILWRKESTGQVVLWFMNADGTRSSYKTLLTDTAWTVMAADDFNGDCIADILWRKESTGQVVLWFMNPDGTRSSYKTLLTDTAWTIMAADDFNADGIADILWRKESTGQVVLWFMNADGTRSSYKTLLTDTAWTIMAADDFNADGIADILWRKESTGQVVLWFMNADGTRSSYKTLLTDTAWTIMAADDFNADGIADILWRKESTGQVVLWFMNADGTRSSYKTLLTDTAWTIMAADDFNADGIADILWRKESTGQVVLWFMNADGTRSSYKTLLTDTAWTLVP